MTRVPSWGERAGGGGQVFFLGLIQKLILWRREDNHTSCMARRRGFHE